MRSREHVVYEFMAFSPHSCGGLVSRSLSARHEMVNVYAVQQHGMISDQTSMASPPQRLAAHDRHPLLPCLPDQILESQSEVRRPHVRGVSSERFISERNIG